MLHKKKFTRPDGKEVKVTVTGFIDWFVWGAYRNGREAIATPDEIYQAKLELWERLKPTP